VSFLQFLEVLKYLRSFRAKSLECFHVTKFDDFTAIFIKIQALRDVTPCRLVNSYLTL